MMTEPHQQQPEEPKLPLTPEQRRRQRLSWKFIEADRLFALTRGQREAYCRLAQVRLRLARDVGVPAYQVFSNRTLLALAEAIPKDEAGLALIEGFGTVRAKAYGAEVLQVLKGHQTGEEKAAGAAVDPS